MSDGTGSSDDDDDYAMGKKLSESTTRYPIHDCCEFEDAETLRSIIFVPHRQSDDEEEEDDDDGDDGDDEGGNVAHHRGLGESDDDDDDDDEDEELEHEDEDDEEESDENDSSQADHDGGPAADADSSSSKVAGTAEGGGVEESGRGETAAPTDGGGPSDEGTSSPTKDSANAGSATDDMDVEDDHKYDNSPIKSTDSQPTEEDEKPAQKKIQYYCPYNLDERDSDENTALHIAIISRKLEHVRLLLEAGASVHKRSDGSPPVHAAISIGAIPQHATFANECVQLLFEKEADLTARDDAMHTPLYLACMYNLPSIASFILSTEAGSSTLNTKADRSQGRALHVAAKFDTLSPRATAAGGVTRNAHIHHPDGSVATGMHHMPGFPGGKQAIPSVPPPASTSSQPNGGSSVTQVLLQMPDVEIDATNSVGQSPLHVACAKGNWKVARLLIEAGANPDLADRRGFAPGQHAHKRGIPIPIDLHETLGGPPTSGIVPPLRDLIVDPDRSTILVTHDLCLLHRTCPPIRREPNSDPPPENVRRLHVLVDQEAGILRTGEFNKCTWEDQGRRAAMADVLKCHEYTYVENVSRMCSSIADHPSAVAHLDADTTMSRWTFEAALRAAGSVCEAVDKVVSGDYRNSFCAVRPPGHHAGPRGIVNCPNDPTGSHGFCFLNNVAIGAAYARTMYRNDGIKKIAIVDFDVHHGNGTEEIIRQLVPDIEKTSIKTPFATGELSASRYRPWLDETDVQDVMFASVHGYGARGNDFVTGASEGWFYPASGRTQTSDAIKNPSLVETPNLTDFLLSQTWARMGEESRANCCKIMNFGMGLPTRDDIPGMQRLEVRDTYRQKILPQLREFDPDLIFISAGFDAHKKDTMNFGYVGMVEDDYEWVTEQLIRLANTCCNGRIVSVLEGGYKIHGGIVSPFARSVAAHVRALVDGGSSRELYDRQDCEWESQFERHLIDERERKRQQKLEKMRVLEEQSRRALYGDGGGGAGDDGIEDSGSRKRRRGNPVDYKTLYEQMKKEGFAG